MAKPVLSDDTIVEVVMTKKMSLANYKAVRASAIAKGWVVNSYEIGFYGKK